MKIEHLQTVTNLWYGIVHDNKSLIWRKVQIPELNSVQLIGQKEIDLGGQNNTSVRCVSSDPNLEDNVLG